MTLDNGGTALYYSYMNTALASALVQAAHRVESRLEEALAGVGLSIAKFETLSVLVSQDRPISLSELAAKLVCVKSNVTQLVDRLEADGLVSRTSDPNDRRSRPAQSPRNCRILLLPASSIQVTQTPEAEHGISRSLWM